MINKHDGFGVLAFGNKDRFIKYHGVLSGAWLYSVVI
jgi:hypothetical protein